MLALLFASAAVAADRSSDGDIVIERFELSSTPTEGRYGPWRDRNKEGWYAGEIITITNAFFRYVTFSDVGDPKHPRPDYSGPIKIFPDHIFLDHPGVPYPYRVAGRADGRPVLVTWEGYKQWKKRKSIFELNILWLQKEDAKKANKITGVLPSRLPGPMLSLRAPPRRPKTPRFSPPTLYPVPAVPFSSPGLRSSTRP
jgi:hypothetical protein